MGVATVAISVKPWAKKIEIIIGSFLISIGAALPSIERILTDSFDSKYLWAIPVVSIIAALSGAFLLTLGITYTRWAKSADWKSDDCVIVEAFIEGKDKGEGPSNK